VTGGLIRAPLSKDLSVERQVTPDTNLASSEVTDRLRKLY
jgi:hypothetical protein